ncbi:restriction endonuclease subunit S [Companilactobacillus heilongjiangensis]|uniref:Type I restriction modification DNA specificity domain-containing protein n=1 Tax=Companilactobacillus heilongjiangensis TaxID=1074467 RepID=A0A0K2LER7_9LACO|nr:restriction endonuclease subunit S [Companilactobacillus heilongjiangensis]ALB29765.1 hypothetical protein JP39_10605 [Companilactobacillus heilongjiangensis]
MDKRVPELRFKGFTDDWEQHKIGDFLKESRIKGSSGLTAKKLTVKLWGKGIVPKEDIYLGSTATQYYIRKEGQFMYGKLDFLHQAFGIVPSYLDGYESTLDSPSFDISKNLNPNFFLEYVSLEKFYKYQGSMANGSRKAKRIHPNIFFEMPILITKIDEQNKIGSIIEKLNLLIELHQKKLNLYEGIRKYMLQNLFPKDKANVPNVRFADFVGDWEQQLIGNLLNNLYNGQTPSRSDNLNWNGNISWLSSGELNKGTVLKTVEKITPEGKSEANLKIVPSGTFVMAITGLEAKGTRGNCAILGINTTLNQSCMALFPNKSKLISGFLFQWYMKFGDEYGIRYTQGTKQQSYNAELIKILPIKNPNITEQKVIVSLLTKLDELIKIQKRQLTLYENIKKYYIQKLFI